MRRVSTAHPLPAGTRGSPPSTRAISKSPPGDSNERLMARYCAGDSGAFSTLFLRLRRPLRTFFSRSFSDGAQIDDLVQITFARIHSGRATFSADTGDLRKWVFGIARRVRLDEWRAMKRRLEVAIGDDDAEFSNREAPAMDEADPRLDAALAALAELPPTAREVVVAHCVADETYAAIAGRLGVSTGAVKLRAFRAYRAMKGRMNDVPSAAPTGGR